APDDVYGRGDAMRYVLLVAQLAMVALLCASLWCSGYLNLFIPWLGIPSAFVSFIACFATELALFGHSLTRDDSAGEVMRRRASFLLYTFAFVVAEPWAMIAALGYAVGLRAIVRRDRLVHVHAAGMAAVAWAVLARRDTLDWTDERLPIIVGL